MREWARHIRISSEDVKAERGIVIEEWRAGRTAAGRMAEDYWATLTGGSRYEQRMPIGKEEVVRGASAELLGAFYRRHYQLARMAVVVVGDVQPADVLELLEREPELRELNAHFETNEGWAHSLAEERAAGGVEPESSR